MAQRAAYPLAPYLQLASAATDGGPGKHIYYLVIQVRFITGVVT